MRKRTKYTEEFKRDAVRLMLARGTRTVPEIADGLGVSQSMLHRWHQRYGAEVGGGAARSQEEREDVEKLRRRLRELEQENTLPKKRRGPLHEGEEVAVFELVHAERTNIPVAVSCRVLGVSRSGYYQWTRSTPSARARADKALSAEVRSIHREHKGRYGSPRVHRELRARGHRVARKRVARLMRDQGICGRSPRRSRRTTDSRHGYRIAPTRLDRDFSAAAPNAAWVGDITYVPTQEG